MRVAEAESKRLWRYGHPLGAPTLVTVASASHVVVCSWYNCKCAAGNVTSVTLSIITLAPKSVTISKACSTC